MERMFTRDVGKRFKKGEVRDYPGATWNDIARIVGRKLDTFSSLVTMVEKKKAATMAAADPTTAA